MGTKNTRKTIKIKCVALATLAHIIEYTVKNAYREREIAAAQESTREHMKFIGPLLRGEVTIQHKDSQ